MTNFSDQPYESPTLTVIGTLEEMTRNGTLANADGANLPDTAQPFVPPVS